MSRWVSWHEVKMMIKQGWDVENVGIKMMLSINFDFRAGSCWHPLRACPRQSSNKNENPRIKCLGIPASLVHRQTRSLVFLLRLNCMSIPEPSLFPLILSMTRKLGIAVVNHLFTPEQLTILSNAAKHRQFHPPFPPSDYRQ